jgi:hypothetical protein
LFSQFLPPPSHLHSSRLVSRSVSEGSIQVGNSRLARSRFFRPQIDVLEDRLLLSIFTVTNTSDSGPGSLRQAILDANGNPGTDTIAFNIGGGGVQTIRPDSQLPIITDQLVIDGTTQPGFGGSPLIVLNGSAAGALASGLIIIAGHSTVQGLVINGFTEDGIDLVIHGSNKIRGNFIGTDASGTQAVGNGASGLSITSSNNLIGGITAGSRNLISGTRGINGTGITISGDGNVVAGNLIGTDISGSVALGNSLNGVSISGADNLIGGIAPGSRNVISGNPFGVVVIQGLGNHIYGNYIGTDVTGTFALPNLFGVFVDGPTIVGGTAPGTGNLISGNGGIGVQLAGIGNIVQGNYIGTDVTGTRALGNGIYGVEITPGSNNLIGGIFPEARNVISGNGGGIHIVVSTGNLVQGNFIGTDVTGSHALGNGNGLVVESSNNLIGGMASGSRNTIAGNATTGVAIIAGGANRIQGNYIGTDVTGTAPVPNGSDGVLIGSTATVGGTAPGAGNLISGNSGDGVGIFGADSLVQGNFIGTDATGTAALGNRTGVSITGSRNMVGGAAAGAGNTIALDGQDGVFVDTGSGNAILRNRIFGHDNGLGIELTNGGNHNQEFPTITSAFSAEGLTTIEGTLVSAPSTTFNIEFFVNSVCNPSGYGEGEHFLASITLTTDTDGNASFSLTVAIEVDPGHFIAATATDPGNNTSQFSQCIEVTGPNAPGIFAYISPKNGVPVTYFGELESSSLNSSEVAIFEIPASIQSYQSLADTKQDHSPRIEQVYSSGIGTLNSRSREAVVDGVFVLEPSLDWNRGI